MTKMSFTRSKNVSRAFLLIAFILACALPSRATQVTINNVVYEIDYNATVCGLADKSIPTDLVIPGTIEYNNVTYPVSEIQRSAFSGCTAITSVTLPNTFTYIWEETFKNCSDCA